MQPDSSFLKGRHFEYDRVLYDRQFMSCLFRHAVVWLQRRGLEVDLLFYNALASSDLLMQQMVIDRLPKFAFRSECFSEADFDLIGAKEHAFVVDHFRDVRSIISEWVSSGQFALVEGNVFHLPHCPEFRIANAQHVVVVHEISPQGSWEIVDDDAASILFRYSYEEKTIERFFENSVNRKIRTFEIDNSLRRDKVSARVEERFEEFVRNHTDSFVFYDSAADFMSNPFDSLATKHRILHDCFALLSGSRKCFVRYLHIRGSSSALVSQAEACSKAAGILKMVMARAKITGFLNLADMVERCSRLKQQEIVLEQLIKE